MPKSIELYERLGVAPDASTEVIVKAYRKKVKDTHPDQGGDVDAFRSLTEAYEVLTNADKRKRYDDTGRMDEGVTEEKVDNFLRQMMSNVVNAEFKDGSTDDPVWENILNKVLLSVRQSRRDVKDNQHKTQRKMERCQRLIERFQPKQEKDPIGDILRAEKKSLEGQMRMHDDAFELSQEAEKVLLTYRYETGPGLEGQYNPGPARPLRGPLFIR